jgi:hypothetical protein
LAISSNSPNALFSQADIDSVLKDKNAIYQDSSSGQLYHSTGSSFVLIGGSGAGSALALAIAQSYESSLQYYVDFTGITGPINVTGAGGTYNGQVVGNLITMGALGAAVIQNGSFQPASTALFYANGTTTNEINRIVCEFTVTAGGSDDPTMTIALGKNDITGSVGNVLHFGFASAAVGNLQIRGILGGARLETVLSTPLYQPLVKNGTTVYKYEISVNNGILQIIGPNGEVWNYADPRIQDILGKAFFWETAKTANGASINITKFAVYGINRANTIDSSYSAQQLQANRGLSTNSLGYPAFNPNTLNEISFSSSANYYGRMTIGPSNLFYATNLASVTSGATTFQCDYPIPNGAYDFDPTSNKGANIETVTVTGVTGSNSPFTITISSPFTKNHAASARGASVLVMSQFVLSSLVLEDNRKNGVNINGTVVGANFITDGSGYSATLNFDASGGGSNNRLRVAYNQGPIPNTSWCNLVVVGGLCTNYNKIATQATGTVALPDGYASHLFNQTTAAQTLTLSFATPVAADDGREIRIANIGTQAATLVFNANIKNGTTAFAVGSFQKFQWVNADASWYRVG